MPRTRPTSRQEPPRIPDPHQRQLRSRLQALRLGATCFAVLAGIACYTLLQQVLHVSATPAVIVGFVFALLVRVAVVSLVRDWLLHAASQSTTGTPPPTPPKR